MKVTKCDRDQQVVYGEVYAPGFPDSDGDFMTAEGVVTMAHQFLAKGKPQSIDVQHDNNVVKASVVESFIAREGDPDFLPGAWVVGVKIEDPDLWELVKSGELNGFSMEALASKSDQEIEIEIPDVLEGPTAEADGHTHTFQLKFDESGNVVSGRTNIVDGHFHLIRSGTLTEKSEGHCHRYSFQDALHA